ncbi:MAG: hypothetical protein V1928_01220 [Parcubacteria group bacterium]
MKNSAVFTVTRKVSLDVRAALAASKQMFRSNGFANLANALPKVPRFSLENQDKIRGALGGDFGLVVFDKGLIFPAAALQESISIINYKKRLADRRLAGLPMDQQYHPSFIEEGVEQSALTDKEAQLRRGAYLWLYSSSPIPQETKGLTFPQEEKLFNERKWNGMALREYYFAQRQECALNQDHRFDAWDSDGEKSNASWCLASACPSGGVYGNWDPYYHRVRVYWFFPNFSSDTLGARPAVVVPMEII